MRPLQEVLDMNMEAAVFGVALVCTCIAPFYVGWRDARRARQREAQRLKADRDYHSRRWHL